MKTFKLLYAVRFDSAKGWHLGWGRQRRWRGNMGLTCGCVRVWGSDMNKKEGEETDGQRGCCKGSCHCQLDAHTGIEAMLHFTDKDGACLLCSYRNYLPHILLPNLSPWPEKLNRLDSTTVLLIHKWPTTKVFIVISYCKNLRGQKNTHTKSTKCAAAAEQFKPTALCPLFSMLERLL